MKKKFRVAVIMCFLSICVYSQNYTFKTAVADGVTVRMKGTVSVSDSIIVLTIKGDSSKLEVVKTSHNDLLSQYRVTNISGDYKIRISLTKEGNKHSLIYEAKDEFTGVITTIIYFLKPE